MGTQPLYWLAVQNSGVSKISEYLGLNMGAESHHSLQGGGTAVISLVFPPKSSYCLPDSLISLQLGTENTVPPLESAQRSIQAQWKHHCKNQPTFSFNWMQTFSLD